MSKKKSTICPICGRPIESITCGYNSRWIKLFGHDVVSDDLGWTLYIRSSNDCKAPPKTYRDSDYECAPKESG